MKQVCAVKKKKKKKKNPIFDDLSCGSGESLVDTTLFIFKNVISLFYYFRFNR